MLKYLQRLGKALMLPVSCLPICGILIDVYKRQEGVLADSSQDTNRLGQTHVSVANGLLVAIAEVVVKGVGVGGPLDTVGVQRVVDHLRGVLTRQALLLSLIHILPLRLLQSRLPL